MLRAGARALLLLAALIQAGCQMQAIQEFPLSKFKAENLLDVGIREYDNGNYRLAACTIEGSLDSGLTTRSQARAHKYLAFMYCIKGQQAPCRDEFRKALEKDPKLELKPEEAGHPLWGPVFKSVKAGKPK